MHIDLTDEAEDGLGRHYWSFRVVADCGRNDPLVIRLEGYVWQERKTRRHGWQKVGEGWRSRTHNSVVHHGGFRMPAKDVPQPKDFHARIVAALQGRLRLEFAYDPKEN
ncbi:hypothetical protein [Planktothrix phage Pra-JY27]|nr:hypothetical protein [Planktothrix phage Pag-Yong1]WEV89243.1 hypothetical protein [Synechococcus phage MinM2]